MRLGETLLNGIQMILFPLLPIDQLGFVFDIFLLLILLIIGIVVIIIIAKVLLFVLPAAIVAAVVWFITGGSLFWAGIAFLAVAFLSILKRK
jgi:hypothetical protein